MQIVETKNNLTKIIFNPQTEHLTLGSFIMLSNDSQRFLAQVINMDAKVDKHYAILKMTFSFDPAKGNFIPYNGEIPAINSMIEMVDFGNILGLLPIQTPLILGKITDQIPCLVDIGVLMEKLLVCVEKQEEKELFITTVLPQILKLSGRVVLFDKMGLFPVPNKIIAGQDFKLPLNYDTINFIYEKGLNDATSETKALIQEIFLEVQNYVKELPEKFIPFENFKAVVDAQYEETQIPELVLLKNKLLKFYENGVFAQEESDFEVLKANFINSQMTVIDISKFDGDLQREVISYVYNVLNEIGGHYFAVVDIDDDNTDKKLLKQMFVSQSVYSVIISPYRYKYLKEIKQLSRNLILFTPIMQQEDFAGYNIFLSKLNQNEFIVYGEKTKNIPFLASLVNNIPNPQPAPQQEQPAQEQPQEVQEAPQQYEEVQTQAEYQEETPQQYEEVQPMNQEEFEQAMIQEDVQEVPQQYEEVPQQYPEQGEYPQEMAQQYEEIPQQYEEVPQQYPEQGEYPQEMVQQYEEMPQQYEEVQPMNQEEFEQAMIQEDVQEVPQQYEEVPQQYPEQEEYPQEMAQQDEEIPQQYEDAPQQNFEPEAQEIPQQYEEIPQQYEQEEPQVHYNEETGLTDDDLDFIQENVAPPEAEPVAEQEEPKEFRETPIVPVYPAETPEEPKSEGQFAQGDVIHHETYGRGVITKIISYGSKVLCSIEFDNNGKKLLDPAVTKLVKME